MENNNKLKINSEDGFTLLEVIVTVAIISLVFVTVMSFFNPRISLFNRASSEANIHSELNNINNKIHKSLRNTTEIKLMNKPPTSFNSSYKYFYINNNKRIVYVNNTGEHRILSNKLKFKNFNISIYKRDDKQNYLLINIDAIFDKADHQIKNFVLLNNISEQAKKEDRVSIRFK